jgi:hypothetical protein
VDGEPPPIASQCFANKRIQSETNVIARDVFVLGVLKVLSTTMVGMNVENADRVIARQCVYLNEMAGEYEKE